jgi:hypothetical protein
MAYKSEAEVFERNMKRELESFLCPEKPRPKREISPPVKTGYIVKLAVRTKKIEMDTIYQYESKSLSKLEATIDAEKAARKAGYPIIGHVHSIDPR